MENYTTSFAFPSGHAHGSTTLWLYIMVYTRHIFFIVFGFVIIILVAISRVYLGVHYLGDVIAGIALGVVTVAIFLILEPKVTRLVNTWSLKRKLFLGTIPPLLLLFYGSLFFSFDDRGVKLAGALLGIILGYVLEGEYVRITVNVSTEKKVIRIILGLFLAFIAYFGLNWLLPFNMVTCFFTSWLGGFMVMFIAPWVFKKIEK